MRARFFRPEAIGFVTRWAETAVWASLTCFAVFWVFYDAALSSPLRWAIGLGAAAVGLWLTRSAALSALSAARGEGPGVVIVNERRITYLGPREGGVISLDEVAVIEIHGEDPDYWVYDRCWILRPPPETGEPALIFPIAAEGADGLIDVFAALPGFSPTRAVGALSARRGEAITIWRRDGAGDALALAPGPARD